MTDHTLDAIDRALEGIAPKADAWRLAEWEQLADTCLFHGCDASPDDMDQRGPVLLRDGSIHKACSDHWEPIFRILGEQASWESTDAMRSGGSQ
jgi:hypothetical protein